MSRKELWGEYDANVKRVSEWDLSPAFMQQYYQDGLWQIQVLARPQIKAYSKIYRLFFNPPQEWEYEPCYHGWPGDRRGWMRFKTKEDARDFYKLATRKMRFEDYRKIPTPAFSGVRIDMDENGDFIT